MLDTLEIALRHEKQDFDGLQLPPRALRNAPRDQQTVPAPLGTDFLRPKSASHEPGTAFQPARSALPLADGALQLVEHGSLFFERAPQLFEHGSLRVRIDPERVEVAPDALGSSRQRPGTASLLRGSRFLRRGCRRVWATRGRSCAGCVPLIVPRGKLSRLGGDRCGGLWAGLQRAFRDRHAKSSDVIRRTATSAPPIGSCGVPRPPASG